MEPFTCQHKPRMSLSEKGEVKHDENPAINSPKSVVWRLKLTKKNASNMDHVVDQLLWFIRFFIMVFMVFSNSKVFGF